MVLPLILLFMVLNLTGPLQAFATTAERPSSPPYRSSVFIFYLIAGRSRKVEPIGTAFSVECASRFVLLTAGHCCYGTGKRKLASKNLFCTKSMERRSDGNFDVKGESFPVQIVYASISPDVGILARTDGNQCENPILMCESSEVPWVADPKNWECRVKCFHCPVDVFRQTDMPLLGTNITDYHMIAYETGDHFSISEIFLGGSSGGAFIMEKGHKLLGVLITTQVTRTDFDGVEYHVADSSSSGSMSVSNLSVAFTTAVVPALLEIGNSRVPLSEFLARQGY